MNTQELSWVQGTRQAFFDRWIPRVGTAALVALAVGLVGLGIALYALPGKSPGGSVTQTMTSGPLGSR